MAINFNIVKKPKKSDNELEEELDEEEENNTSKSSMYDPKKKMIRFMGIIVVVMIIILLILFVVSSLSNNKTKTYSYSEIEKILVDAAKSYFKDNPSSLPVDDDYSIEVDSSTLTEAGYMEDLNNYTKEDVTCTGSVQVEKNDDDYFYNPNLNCGDAYSTIPFYDKVLNDNSIVSSGYGLYASSGSYVFRGENIDNYVQLDKSLWRIVKITSNNNVVLVHNDGVGYSQPWDNRYNEETKYESGINNYEASRVRESLNRIYKITDEKDEEMFLSKSDKNKLVDFNLCVGKRDKSSTDKNNSPECKHLLKDQKLGLLTLSDYLYASIDPNCKSAETKSCKNYNYLTIKDDWWLITASSNDTTSVFYISNGATKMGSASDYAVVRPVIYLNEKVMFKSGKGTLEKPYKVR